MVHCYYITLAIYVRLLQSVVSWGLLCCGAGCGLELAWVPLCYTCGDADGRVRRGRISTDKIYRVHFTKISDLFSLLSTMRNGQRAMWNIRGTCHRTQLRSVLLVHSIGFWRSRGGTATIYLPLATISILCESMKGFHVCPYGKCSPSLQWMGFLDILFTKYCQLNDDNRVDNLSIQFRLSNPISTG